MPELPDLEAVKNILNPELTNVGMTEVEVSQPRVIQRPPAQEFRNTLIGDRLSQIDRRGKFLLFRLASKRIIVIHPMLSGRFQYCDAGQQYRFGTCLIFHLENSKQLTYLDPDSMGRVYLVEEGQLSSIPHWDEMGPDVLNDDLTEEVFKDRLGRYRGRIKNILIKDTFVQGIGNAYADEILFASGIHPHRAQKSLADEEKRSLYQATRSVLKEAVEILSERMKDDTAVEIRDFLKVHRKGGTPCPVCGTTISQIEVSRRITNFCPNCQRE
ncbi:MAG: Fpg/Nei family DNA glycosylase [Dehalococcoidia bacterium]